MRALVFEKSFARLAARALTRLFPAAVFVPRPGEQRPRQAGVRLPRRRCGEDRPVRTPARSFEVVLRLGVYPSADPERARAACRRILATYLNATPYARFHTWLGRGAELAPLQQIQGFVEAGVTTPILQIMSTGDDPMRWVRALAPAAPATPT